MASETVQIQSLTDLSERLFAKPPALQVSQGDINRWRLGGTTWYVSAPGDGLPRVERVRHCSLSLPSVCLIECVGRVGGGLSECSCK